MASKKVWPHLLVESPAEEEAGPERDRKCMSLITSSRGRRIILVSGVGQTGTIFHPMVCLEAKSATNRKIDIFYDDGGRDTACRVSYDDCGLPSFSGKKGQAEPLVFQGRIVFVPAKDFP